MSTSGFRGKRFTAVFFALAAAGLAAAAVVVAVVDPFFRYHDPIEGFPYVIDNQLSQNIGMAERFDYDSVITGSSMTMNFNTRDFGELMGLDTIKLTMNGALPRDIDRILEPVFGRGGDVRAVFIAIDAATWTAERGAEKYPYPEYLYDRNPFNDVKYLWNKEVILNYCLRPMAEREATDLSTVYSTDWEDDMYYTLQWILDHYEEPEAEDRLLSDAYIADTERNLAEYLLPYIDGHPETEFFFFFPPYSVLYWHNAVVEGHLEATLAQEQYIVERLLERGNARVFQFQDIEDIVTEIDGGYMDEIHFRPRVNRYMTECFSDGGHEILSAEDMRASLDDLEKIVNNFDFDAILK